jgi:hypothetical protein
MTSRQLTSVANSQEAQVYAGVSRDGDRPKDLQEEPYELESGTLGYKKKTSRDRSHAQQRATSNGQAGFRGTFAVSEMPLSSRTSFIDLRGNRTPSGSEPERQHTNNQQLTSELIHRGCA